MSQLKIFRLNCIGCNGNLEIPSDTTKFVCSYCGIQQIVYQKGGIVQLKEVVDAISKVQSGTDKTAAELAIKRLTDDINSLRSRSVEKSSYWKSQLDPKMKELEQAVINKQASENIIRFFLLILCFFATLLICGSLGVLVSEILKRTFELSHEMSKNVFVIILIVSCVPLFMFIYRLLRKFNNSQINQSQPSKVDKLKDQINLIEKNRDYELNIINNEIRENTKKIALNKQIVDV